MTCWASPTRTTLWAIGSAVGITAITAAYLAAIYPSLPIGVPVRYVAGRPFIYQMKSPLVVMLPAIVQAGLLLVFGALILLLLWRAEPARRGNDVQADDTTRMGLAAEGIALLAAIWIAVQALGAVRLIVLWRGAWGGFGRVYSMAFAVAIVISIVVMTRTMKLVRRRARTAAAADNPSLWRLRQLYFNPRDPALFVPARTGVGFTLNFGRPLAIVMLVATLAIGMWAPYTLAKFVLRGFSLDN